MTIETTTTVMTEGEARRITERIRYTALSVRDGVEKLQRLVGEAQAGSAHLALGYPSWTAYLADVLGDEPMRLPRDERREIVAWLSGEGMSTRAIAPIVGANRKTVMKDVRESQVVQSGPPAQPPTIATTEGVVIAEQRHVELDETDWDEGEVAEVMDDDNAGVTCSNEPTPEPKPITGMDGKTYQRPEPKPQRRNPLPDQFNSATLNLTRATTRLVNLIEDDRLPQNREKVATANRSDLLRAIDALQRVVASLD